MANMKVVIDGDTVMDGDTATWEAQQPEFLAEQMKNIVSADFKPEPYMRALMLVIAETATTGTGTQAVVTTFGTEGWSIDVTYEGL